MQHLWFRALDTRGLRRARAALRAGPARVYADTVTPAAAAALARKPLPPGCFEIVLASMAVEDEHGCNIRARAETLGAILARKAAGEADGYRWLAPEARPWGAEWLRIVGAHYVQHGPELSNYLAFVETVYRVDKIAAPERVIIDLGRHEVAAAYAEHAAQPIDLTFPVEVRGRSPAPLGVALRVLGRQTAQFAYLVLRWLLRGRTAEIQLAATASNIALVGYERGMLERLPLGATIDWFEFSGLPPERVVFLFNRSDSPLDDVARAKLASYGFGWADFSAVSRLDQRAFVGLAQSLIASLRTLPAPWNRQALRRWTVVAQLHPLVKWYRTFLCQRRAAAFFQGAQFAPAQMALNLACRQEQVAIVWSFWSVMLMLEQACHHAFADLLVAWGDYDVGYCRALSFDYRYAVKAGAVTYDGVEFSDPERAKELRARLTARPRFVLAVFDSAHEPRGIHHTPERCAEFYRVVLDLVRKNPNWGCLIKSKAKAYDDLPQQPGLQDIVAALESEGRCIRLPNAVKPTLVSLAADAIVCYSVNSAGIQAALGTSRPVLFFDNNHLYYHPFALDGADSHVIFRNADHFAQAIQRLARGERGLGDISKWTPLIDSVHDGYGRKRAGAVLRDYFAARDHGANRDIALYKAVKAHAQRSGATCVNMRSDPDNASGDQLWRKVRARYYAAWPDDFPYSQNDEDVPADESV